VLRMKATMELVEAAVFYTTRRGSTPADWMSSAVLQHTAWHRLYSTSAAATMTSPSAAWMLSQ
jgi:hypothetical protein